MTTKRTTPDTQGGSRAAKKRAKKRQQQDVSKTESGPEKIEEIKDKEEDEQVVQPKSKKLQLLMSSDDDDEQPKERVQKKKKKKAKSGKMQLPMGDDDDEEPQDIVPKKKKKSDKTKEKKAEKEVVMQPQDVDMDGENHPNGEDEDVDVNAEEQVLNEILSQLNPIEILFPERLIGMDNAGDDDAEDDEPNPLILVQHIDTKRRARAVFESILAPCGITVEEFYEEYWEQKPLIISKSKNIAEVTNEDDEAKVGSETEQIDEEELQKYRSRFNGFLSKKKIEDLISNHPMRYGKDLNVTNFCDTGYGEKRRVTLDQFGAMKAGEDEFEAITAESNDVWQNFETGCTLRLLCPQKHNDEVHALLSNMEHEFGCMVGSNVYLTPGGAPNQGFAPHYDDIEAFILQLEGYKHWRVYPPMSKAETLPRGSSPDFTEADMKDIDAVIDIELGPGDMLYMPRGWVHQANTCRSKHHSLHLTMSAMQNWSWVDFLELIMPEALEAATTKATSMRSGLPRNFLNYMGTMHEQVDSKSKDTPEALRQLAAKMDEDEDEDEAKQKKRIAKMQAMFKAEAKKKIMRVCKEALSMVTTGCDQIAKRFLSDRLPPAFNAQELTFTSDNRAENGGKVWPNTLVRLAKPGIAHLVIEDDKAVIYHSADNSRVYHETALSPLEFEIDDAPALEMLLTTIEPHWICVEDLIHGDIEDKMELSQALYDEGILAIFQDKKPDTSVQTG